MSTANLEWEVLGRALHQPEYLARCQEDDFWLDKNRQIYLAAIRVFKADGFLDLGRLLTSLGEKAKSGTATYLAEVTEGIQKITEPEFLNLLGRLRSARQFQEFLSEVERQKKAEGQGQPPDVPRLKELLGEVEKAEATGHSRFVEARLSEVDEEPIAWLWEDVFPIGMLSIITGNPSVGKTFTAAWIASRLSLGEPFPGRQTGIKGETLYLTRESPQKTVLKPRLVAAGADCSKIIHIQGIYDDLGQAQVFDVGKSLPLMERKLDDNPEIRLIIPDPIISFMDLKTDTNNPGQVRHAMDVLAVFADRRKIAVIVIMHLNKNMAQEIIQRNSGSIQFMAAAQVGWVVGPDPDPDHKFRKLMMPAKNNLAPMTDTWAFDVETHIYQNKDGKIIKTGRATFLDEPKKDVDVSAIISPFAAVDPTKLSKMRQAQALLMNEVMKGGPKDAKDLERLAREKGISRDSLYKAKLELGIDDTHIGKGEGSKSVWFYDHPADKGAI